MLVCAVVHLRPTEPSRHSKGVHRTQLPTSHKISLNSHIVCVVLSTQRKQTTRGGAKRRVEKEMRKGEKWKRRRVGAEKGRDGEEKGRKIEETE